MSNEILQTLNNLIAEVEVQARLMGWSYQEAFFEKMSEILVENGDIKSPTFVEYENQDSRGLIMRADGYHFDEDDDDGKKVKDDQLNELTIIVSDFTYEAKGEDISKIDTLNTQELEKKYNQVKRFIEACSDSEFLLGMEPSSPDAKLIGLITKNFRKIDRINIHYVTTLSFSGRLKEFADDSVKHIKLNKQLFDINRYHNLLTSKDGGEPTEIIFDDFGYHSLIALKTNKGSRAESLLLAIPGQLLFGIYEQYGARLLEQNVRTFLSARGKVNKMMIATLKDKPSMFFSYNNGLTATASEVISDEQTENTISIKGLKNLQVVNGGQTTAAIHYSKFKNGDDLSEVFVQMKLSIIDPEKLDEVVPKIAEYANSQNKVNAADFFANHPFHRSFEELSRRFKTPKMDNSINNTGTFWFYERARGAYSNELTKLKLKSEKDAFTAQHPKHQRVTKEDLAKALMSFEGHPDVVSKGGQAAFLKHADKVGMPDDFKKKQNTINETFFNEAIAKIIIFRELEKLISKAEWYEGGGSRACTITYSLAWLAQYLKAKGKILDLQIVWKQQELTEDLEKLFIWLTPKIYEALKDSTRDNLTAVPQWAKRKGCWDIIKNFDCNIDNNLLDGVTISKEMKKWESPDKPKGQREYRQQKHWIAMTSIRPENWQAIYTFLNRHEIMREVPGKAKSGISKFMCMDNRTFKLNPISEDEAEDIFPIFELLSTYDFPFSEQNIDSCLYR